MDTKSNSIATPVPTQAGAYVSGQIVGGLLAIAQAAQHVGTGVVLTVKVADKAKQDAVLDVFFFNGTPAGVFTDAATWNPSDADNALIAGVVRVNVADYSDGSANSVGCPPSKPIVFKGAPPTDPNRQVPFTLNAVIVARGTPTYGANGLSLTVGILQD